MKQLKVSPITNDIVLANFTDLGNGIYKKVSKAEVYTDEAIRAVFEWFMKNHKENEPCEAYEVTYKGCDYVLQMIKKPQEVENE